MHALTLTWRSALPGLFCIAAALAGPPAVVSPASPQEAVAMLANPAAAFGEPLLPQRTVVDAVIEDDGIYRIGLTLPAGTTNWAITPSQMEAISETFAAVHVGAPGFRGVEVRVRGAGDGAYRPLEDYVAYNASSPDEPPTPVTPPDFEVSEASAAIFAAAPADGLRSGMGGALAHGARQPTGALSGVVIFCSAGHGWTADTSTNGTSWFLQRPVTLDMNEDYGNLDQLNAFVHYAYNAGATVVPFRPVGHAMPEVVLDNDDAGVTFTGTWTAGTGSKYYEGAFVSGVPYVSAPASPVETHTARYTPVLPETGFYPVYTFALAGTNRVPQLYRIKHSGGITEVRIDHRAVGNGWIFLGSFHLLAGKDNYVEIANASPVAGVVIADAIRFGIGMGNIVRPGPDTVSGFPKDEECSRYWAHGELGNNAVGFDAGAIWNSSGVDQDDNVSTAARWAREMNQVPAGGVEVDRWKRVYLEFHTNAFNGTGRGSVGLFNSSNPTTNQEQLAATVCNELDNDFFALEDFFEHFWGNYGLTTLGGAYGAISSVSNGNEFDATILEVAFHDNPQDAALLRDPSLRQAVARTSVQGLIRFLNGLPGSTVPLAFPPIAPTNFRVEDLGGGDVRLSWNPPASGGTYGAAYGDPASGYVVYVSTNGYGFTPIETLGNVLTTTLHDVPVMETRYYRVAATNAGGESMPTQTLAVRRPDSGTATVLIVDAFDQNRRVQNPRQDLGIGVIERQIHRRSNSYDYTVLYAQALEATTVGFASCTNEAVAQNQVQLSNYPVVLWFGGNDTIENNTLDSTEDRALTADERTKLEAFLTNGGGLLISGSDLARDLAAQGGAAGTFLQNVLRVGYISDNAATYDVAAPPAGGIFTGVAPFDFDPLAGAAYPVYAPDVINPQSGAFAALRYGSDAGPTAAVQYDSGVYRSMTLAFPLEAISSAAARAELLGLIVEYLEDTAGPLLFDLDFDGDVDLADFDPLWKFCFVGPKTKFPPTHLCATRDGDGDRDVDLADFLLFQQVFTGSDP